MVAAADVPLRPEDYAAAGVSWTVIRGTAYDLSHFVASGAHPGGDALVRLAVGRDATALVESNHLRPEQPTLALKGLPVLHGFPVEMVSPGRVGSCANSAAPAHCGAVPAACGLLVRVLASSGAGIGPGWTAGSRSSGTITSSANLGRPASPAQRAHHRCRHRLPSLAPVYPCRSPSRRGPPTPPCTAASASVWWQKCSRQAKCNVVGWLCTAPATVVCPGQQSACGGWRGQARALPPACLRGVSRVPASSSHISLLHLAPPR